MLTLIIGASRRFLSRRRSKTLLCPSVCRPFLEAKEIRVQSENALGNIPFYLSRHDLSCCHDYLRGYGDTVPTQHSWNCNHTAGPAHMVLSYLASAPRRLGRALIKVYRHGFSALSGFDCRHLPTCSDYGDEAIGRFGLWAGGWMTLARLCRCHPFGTSGLDFVPASLPDRARWYLPWRYGRWRGTTQVVEHAPPK